MGRFSFVCFVLVGCFVSHDIFSAEGVSDLPQIHPRVFSLVTGWPADGEEPVVTEINLDAVSRNRNQFETSHVKTRDGWTESPGADGRGFERYRVIGSDNGKMTVEFQSNGGGTFTSASMIEFIIESRELQQNGKRVIRKVLRVTSIAVK
ncbi:MAG: hypothetical protein ACK58L_13395 [Planctomycetota bacterium]